MSSSSPAKILFFDHTAAWGGGEVALFHVITNLDRNRFEPLVVLGEEGPLAERLREAGVDVQILALPTSVGRARKDGLGWRSVLKLGRIFQGAAYCWRLCRCIRKARPAVVFTNSLKSDVLGGVAARLSGVKVVWNVQDRIASDYLPQAMVRLIRTMARWVPHAVVANSKATLETLHLPKSGRARRARVIHCGVQIPERVAMPRESETLTVGIIGRLASWKGQHVFLRAAAKVLPKFPTVRFRIVGAALFGEEPYAAELRALTAVLGLEANVDFLGFQSDIPRVLERLDIVVHASTTAEPFGLVVAEAMAAGRAVVATRGGGVPEIVRDRETGLLVPMGDAEALAQGMLELLQDSALRERLGRAGRGYVEGSLTVQRQAAQVMELLTELCSPPPALRLAVAATEPTS